MALCLLKQAQRQHYHVRAAEGLVGVVDIVDVVFLKRLHGYARLQEVDWGMGEWTYGSMSVPGYGKMSVWEYECMRIRENGCKGV